MILTYQDVQKIRGSIEKNFLMQIINDSTRIDPLLDLLYLCKEEMVENVKVKDSLGCIKHVVLMIHREENKKNQHNYSP